MVSELIAAAFRGEDQLSRPIDLIFVLRITKAKPEFCREEVSKPVRGTGRAGAGGLP